jgi:rhamnosyltransferase
LMATNIAVVVVLYNPSGPAVCTAVSAWLAQSDLVVCVDNGGGYLIRDKLLKLGAGRIDFVEMGRNAGVGTAQNRGIERARALGCTHVLLSDQDSSPRSGMVSELLRVESLALSRGIDVSAVGPRQLDAAAGHLSYFVRFGSFRFAHVDPVPPDDWVVADFLIASGSLMRMSVLDEVGPMDEGLFIDLVDTEWFLRARHMGKVAIGACGALLSHSLGEHTLAIKLGRARTLPVHKPFRYYYMFRNSLVMYRRSYVRRDWVIPDAVRLIQMILFFGIVHPARRENLPMILRGIFDGLRGAHGPMRERTTRD